VNPGGGAGWDEFPLDIQIPDDARELDRDVLAYHREQRAKRRRSRLRRLGGPLAGHGAIMPLLASILAVCLVAGAMLSVATFSPATAPSVRTPAPTLAASSSPSHSSRASSVPSSPAAASPSSSPSRPATARASGTGRASHSAGPSAATSRLSPSSTP
jgi:predicted lipid-binding transport protein (Tim44 family)